MQYRRLAPALAICFALGCAGVEDVDKSQAAVSIPGPWDIPDATLAIGDTQSVEYTGAGPWRGESGCGAGLTDGASVLREFLMASYPQIRSIGGYSCRAIVGNSSQMSVHATGRALDIMLPLHAGDADNDLGDPIGNWLIEHAEEIGIQYIIWDRWTWGAHRSSGEKERSYGGSHPHHDHLHVEISTAASRMETPWFRGAMDPPMIADCEQVAAGGGVVEEDSRCVSFYGPAQYWRTEAMGHGGSLRWTNAFQNADPSNWARWHLRLEEAGEYEVEVYVEPEFGVHHDARYLVAHGDQEHSVEVDLSLANGWTSLGSFPFAAGGGQHVAIYDNSENEVGADQHIPADAIRLTAVDSPVGPGESVNVVDIVVAHEPIWVGDPTLDDDGYVGRETMTGCSVRPGASSGAPLWALLGLGLLFRRRRA